MKKSILLSLCLLILSTCLPAQSVSADSDSTYKPFFYGVISGKRCLAWTDTVANEIMQDIQNSIACDSIISGLQNELVNADAITTFQQKQIDVQFEQLKLLKEADSKSESRILVCQIESAKELSSAKRRIWILKAERIIYPILSASSIFLLMK